MKVPCKILSTLGPTSDTKEDIRTLLRVGANAFRLNFSHGSHEDHLARIQTIRELEQETGTLISVVADMQGAKFRVGTFADGPVTVEKGDTFSFFQKEVAGDQKKVSLPHPEIFSSIQKGDVLAVDDGLLRFSVTKVGSDKLVTKVLVGGTLQDRKGVNVPGVLLPIDEIIPKDRRDIAFACEAGVDWIALSFVQTPDDVMRARDVIKDCARVIAKIETPSAIESIDAIIDASDAIMIARGDLGVEVPAEEVPYLQKTLIAKCNQAKKPAIVATQLLDSMIRQPMPTRAEISDVANAVYDGADVCMLSGETASGKYPDEAVEIMRRVIDKAEQDLPRISVQVSVDFEGKRRASPVIASVCEEARQAKAAALALFSSTGDEVEEGSLCRLSCPIVCLTPDTAVARRLALLRGVEVDVTPPVSCSLENMEETARKTLSSRGIGMAGDTIIIAGDRSVCPEGEGTVFKKVTL
ncbi:MAG: pyruvate kinase [Candidatus Kaiserbacteria bacterium]|nr:pyruvate kinase [Candidatus Kaiserbacteria bacterium]